MTASASVTDRSAPPTLLKTPQYGRLAGLSWLHFLNDGSANYLPGILPAVLLALHQSTALAGTVMSALMIGQAFQVVSGWLADRIGGRLFILAGVFGSSLAAAMIGFAPSLGWLIPALVVLGFSNSLFHPQALAGAHKLSGDRPGFGMSLFLIGGEVGRGLWPLIASVVVVLWGLHYLWLLAIPGVLSVLLLWNQLPLQNPRHPDVKPIAWRRHLAPMSLLVAFSLLRSLAIFGLVTFLPIIWSSRGHDLTQGAALITVLLVVGIVGNVGGGHLADRVGRRPVLLGSSLLGALLLVAFMFSGGLVQWLVLGLLGIALFASLPLGILIGQDIFPENRSLGSGIALGFSNGLAAVALSGLGLVSALHGPETVLWVLVGALIFSGLLSLGFPRQAHTAVGGH
ncbi:MFS transporter [Oleiagrimonas sp.]|jgi:FSR family fosmidomycin resistance protein-like MFS transporter|uniref:MFS transporter n=1 Tax=Oleiagrimonas sp. TaxID=2010330 RepID=UPI00261F7C16|nr:MFS transporter [Oleiagrimonas sp.]MDA3912846.1 MFS transporter [Oleiagrimonas sp.]